MRNLIRATPARLLGAAAGSALIAAALIVANPYPGSVLGQSVPDGTVVSPSVSAPGIAVAPLAGTAPVVTSQTATGATGQQPVALPRTGVGLGADNDLGGTAGYALLAVAAGLGSAAVVLRVRRTRA